MGQKILVCTDIAARGLDTSWVGHVILFDFPFNPIDYLHRVGRTARAGRAGKVTALVSKGDQVLANAIAEAHQKGLPIDELSSDKRLQKLKDPKGKKTSSFYQKSVEFKTNPPRYTHLQRALGAKAQDLGPAALQRLYKEGQMYKSEKKERQIQHESWVKERGRRQRLKSRSWGEQRRIRKLEKAVQTGGEGSAASGKQKKSSGRSRTKFKGRQKPTAHKK